MQYVTTTQQHQKLIEYKYSNEHHHHHHLTTVVVCIDTSVDVSMMNISVSGVSDTEREQTKA